MPQQREFKQQTNILLYVWWVECSQWSGRPGFNRVIPKTLKWYLIPPCLTLSNIRYIFRVKWSNPGKGVAPSATPRCSSYWKGSLLATLDYGRQHYLILYVLTNFYARTGYETRSIFKADFFFLSYTGCHTKVKGSRLPYYLFLPGRWISGYILFFMVLVLCEM